MAYDECKVNGSTGVIIHMNGCKYTFTGGAEGRTEPGGATLHIVCPTGEVIETTLPSPSNCVFRVGAQTLGGGGEKGGIGYHTIGTTPNREVTVTANLKRIVVTTAGECKPFIQATELEATLTTGNTIVTGQTEAGVMADAWFE